MAGVAAATAGTLFLVVRVWGGVTDLFAGRIADATTTRWGRFRPYVLFGSIPLLASALLCLAGMFSLQTVGVYYARDVLNDANLYIMLTVVQNLGMIVAAVALPKMMGLLGKKGAYLLGGMVAAAGGAGVAVAPGSMPWIGIVAFGVLGMGLGMTNTLIFAFQADTVDYGEWRSGVRAEGSSYAVLSFTRKAGQDIGGAIAAYTIGLGGYISGGASQTDTAVTSIRVAAGAIPAGLIIGAVAVMLAYPLTEKAFRTMVAEMAQRRVGEAAAAQDATDQ